MPIKVMTTTIVICDKCGEGVVGDYVDTGIFGCVYHPQHWIDLGGPDVAQALGLDSVVLRKSDGQRIENSQYGRRRP